MLLLPDDRRTALHISASEGHMVVVEFLVEKGAKINRSDRWGGSPLDDAHRHQQSHIVKFLRAKGATTGSVNQTVNFITAAAGGDVDEVRLLLDVIPNINEGDYDKRTALHLAAGEGHVGVVSLLCMANADTNAEDRWGGRPLDDAERNRNTDVVRILKNFGARKGGTHSHVSTSSDDMSLEDNYLVIQFESLDIIERIGAGAFGEIYKCRWRGTLVAAKIIKTADIRREWLKKHALKSMKYKGADVDAAMHLLDEASQSNSNVAAEQKDAALSDFRQEIAVLKNLRHPNICLLLGYCTTEGREVMISELMKCSLLDVFKAYIIQGTKMQHKQALIYAQQLAQGMNYLHTCDPIVLHRDLKPANLLIDNAGNLKISDFGLAKVRSKAVSSESESYTMTGETGSYRFMAPEVYRHEEYNETVDVYSYAMILYYLLDGKPPWPLVNGLVAVKKAALEAERPNIPRKWDLRLSNLVQECWDENASVRPSFEKVLPVLDDYMKSKFRIDADGPAGADRRSARDLSATQTTGQGCACTIL
jgi:serine/threonine protein kinase